ncbi:hypothetical protein [Limnohabitans sp. WS1]|uniref:hypothetical protein n=1 Tax=Limnohabitans sp. WS1 TaxID=1100726 RepID=UPI000D3396AF|nr:hypothetical protein [Limnohabitans sp. WS1]PUE13516.1 hypothetical protein B9Z48_15120 [Limnohabitans sp. WS1]
MKLHTLLYDFVDVIGKAPNMERILLTPNDDGVAFRASSEIANGQGRYVVLGKTNDNVDYIDQELGIQSLSYIGKVINAPGFTRLTTQAYIDEIKWSILNKNLRIENDQGECIKLGLFFNEGIDLHMTQNKFSVKPTINYEAHFRPNGADLDALKYWMKISDEYLSDDFLMTPSIENGKLYLKVGMCDEMSFKMKLADRVSGKILVKQFYEGDVFHSIASMRSEVKDLIASFSDQGACRIRALTHCAEYNFILPARKL